MYILYAFYTVYYIIHDYLSIIDYIRYQLSYFTHFIQ